MINYAFALIFFLIAGICMLGLYGTIERQRLEQRIEQLEQIK